MLNSFIGRKLRQTQAFTSGGVRIPVTEIEAGPCVVIQTKTKERDGYESIQLGFGTMKEKHSTKPLIGHIQKTGKATTLPRFFREVSFTKGEGETPPQSGETITIDKVFQTGDIVKVTGISKGKGFAGVVKRHSFRGGPRTHGQSDRERAPGSIGQTTTPGRVYKGKRMAGRMGSDRVSIRGLKIVEVKPEENKLIVKGLIPGALNSIVMIHKQV